MPSVPPAPGLGPFRALERQRPPRPQTRRGSLPVSHSRCNTPPSALFLWVAECGAGGRGRRGAANPARASYLSASIRPTELGLLLGLRGWGGSHGLGSRLPPAPSPQALRWPRAGAPGPGDRRRADGRRRLLRGSAGRGGGVCWAPPGGDLGAILPGRTKAAGEGLAPPNPHPRGLALNLNLYLTLCPEGGEGTHLS